MKVKTQRSLPTFFAACILTLFGGAAVSQNDDGITAKEALQQISDRFGPNSIEWIAEIRGKDGIPQPFKWEVLTYDAREPKLLAWFDATARGRAEFEGGESEPYTINPPTGYVSPDDIKMDSKAAFRVAEAEATKARMGFDSLNYRLKVREFSREPIWRIDLYNDRSVNVGTVFLSAESGEVLRTIWVYTDDRARPDGRPRIVDSATPGATARTSMTEDRPAVRIPEISATTPRMVDEEAPEIIERLPIPDAAPERPAAPRPRVETIEPHREPAPVVVKPEPSPEGDRAARLRDMRKKSGSNELDTRIPPPPIPPGN